MKNAVRFINTVFLSQKCELYGYQSINVLSAIANCLDSYLSNLPLLNFMLYGSLSHHLSYSIVATYT